MTQEPESSMCGCYCLYYILERDSDSPVLDSLLDLKYKFDKFNENLRTRFAEKDTL